MFPSTNEGKKDMPTVCHDLYTGQNISHAISAVNRLELILEGSIEKLLNEFVFGGAN